MHTRHGTILFTKEEAEECMQQPASTIENNRKGGLCFKEVFVSCTMNKRRVFASNQVVYKPKFEHYYYYG